MSPKNLAKAQRRRVRARQVSPLFFAPPRLCGRYEMGECVFSGYLRRALQSVSQGPETGQNIMAENGVFRRPSLNLLKKLPQLDIRNPPPFANALQADLLHNPVTRINEQLVIGGIALPHIGKGIFAVFVCGSVQLIS